MAIHVVLGAIGSGLLGAAVGMALEESTGALHRLLRSRHRHWRGMRRLQLQGRSAEFIRLGDDTLFVHQFVPAGWRPENISFIELSSDATAESELLASEHPLLPRPAPDLISAIRAERRRLEERPDGQWNGPTVAVSSMSVTDRTAENELPELRLRVYRSDHASKQVVSKSWHELADVDTLALQRATLPFIPGMVQAIGLNATVVTSDGFLLLVRRSEQTSSRRTGWHISVNEGMLPHDRVEGLLSPVAGLVRGVEEELGMIIAPSSVTLHTVMTDVTRYQLGLLGHIDLRDVEQMTAADFMAARKVGRPVDRLENVHMEVVPWKPGAVIDYLRDPDWIAHGRLALALSAVSAWPSRTSDILAAISDPQLTTPLKP